MDFMLWAALSLHIFSVVIWLGSLCFLSAILYPVLETENQSDSGLTEHIHRRLIPFLWLSLWTIGITGVSLYIFSPDFLYGNETNQLLKPVNGKIILFLIIIFCSIWTRNLFIQYRDSKKDRIVKLKQIARVVRLTIFFAIITLLLTAWESYN